MTNNTLELREDELADIADLQDEINETMNGVGLPEEYTILVMAKEYLEHKTAAYRAAISAKGNQSVGNTTEHKRLSDAARGSATVCALIKKRYPKVVELSNQIAILNARRETETLNSMMLNG